MNSSSTPLLKPVGGTGGKLESNQPQPGQGTENFVNLVGFKWLMAGIGLRINLTRLQSDPAYGCECLALALACRSDTLREYGGQMLGLTEQSCANSHGFVVSNTQSAA